jgi:2-oxoglutarate dehydrogenase E2 component (dihydrolipoamide succinyltransferase)
MDIKIPEVGESVYEALVAKWHKGNGEFVRKDEPVCELETDKITLELNAEADGVLAIAIPAGQTVKIGTVIGRIAEQAAPAEAPAPPAQAPAAEPVPLSPAVRKLAAEKGVDAAAVPGSGRRGRVTVEDVMKAGAGQEAVTRNEVRGTKTGTGNEVRGAKAGTGNEVRGTREEAAVVRSEEPAGYGVLDLEPRTSNLEPAGDARVTRTPMSPIRRRIAERLLAARSQTAMLTTFNEADLGSIMALRTRHKEHFREKHGVTLGLMSFFVKACCEALKAFPLVNASIDGNDIVRHHYYDIGIAIGGDKGLVVPMLRDADRLHFYEIEQQIGELVARVRENRLAIADLEGGTFTISNGGVYGSLLSTPILNPPQSGVLGMHAIQERPVVRDGQVVVRPMMYLALSYDHRLIDGREAVGFLKMVKELVEEPEELFLEG